jgi:tetratricopeptide (TPR) repeat protein
VILLAFALTTLLAAKASGDSSELLTTLSANRQSQSAAPKPPAAGFAELAKRADAAREAGRLEEAIGLYRQGLRLKPDWKEGRWYLGTSYYELDRYAEAAAAFRRVVAVEPNHGAAWGFRGLCEFQLKQYEPALTSLLKAREFGVGSNQELASVVRYHTAILLTRFNQFEFAQKVLTELTSNVNDSPKVLEAFGLATLRIPQLPDEIDPGRREQLLLAGAGTFYYYSRMTAAALGRFEELLRRFPETPNAHYAFGVVLLNEFPDRAIEEFKKELERSPGHVPSMLQLAFEYIKRSDWTNAKPWAEEAVKADGTSLPARQALGQVLLELDDVNGAIEQLKVGVTLAPESAILHFTLARAYRKAGRPEDAERERLEFQRLDRKRPRSDGGREPQPPDSAVRPDASGATDPPKR